VGAALLAALTSCAEACNTIAWYVLSRGDSVTARGPTSLVLRRSGGRWFIVHDHSS
jgi:hypothetical protein